MRDLLTNKNTAWCNGGRRETFAVQSQHGLCIIRSKRIQNMHKSFVVKPHWKMLSAFGTVGPQTLWDTSLWANIYEWTFHRETCYINWAINVNREKHRRKSHRVCRRDREPSRIPIQSLKRLRNKNRKVRKFVYARILSCIPMSSTLYCYVHAKKLLHKGAFKFNCRERIRQSIKKVIYRASPYLKLFSCNKLMCSCKSEAHIKNYCNS